MDPSGLDYISFDGEGQIWWNVEEENNWKGMRNRRPTGQRYLIGSLEYMPVTNMVMGPRGSNRMVPQLGLPSVTGSIVTPDSAVSDIQHMSFFYSDLAPLVRNGRSTGGMSEADRLSYIRSTITGISGAVSAHAAAVSNGLTVEDVAPVTNRVAGAGRVVLAGVEAAGAVASAPSVAGPVVLGTLAANEGYAGFAQIWTGDWEMGFIGHLAGDKVETALSILTPAGLAARARYLARPQGLEKLGRLREPAGFSNSPLAGKLPAEAVTLGFGRPLTLDPGRTYLYAVRQDGKIIIAPEDLRLDRSFDEGAENFAKHNDLAEGGQARIAGEINYIGGRWVVNTNSGRYMMGRDASPEQLQRFVELLRANLLNVRTAP